jgi:hypothetical protein
MKKNDIRPLFYIILFNLLTVNCFSQSDFQNDATLKIHIVKRKSDSKKIYHSGNGFLISKQGQFVTSYELIRDAIKYPRTYKIQVINNNNDEVVGIKLAGCGNKKNIDICLLKANYTISKPFSFEKKQLLEKETIQSTTLLKKNSISSNKGQFISYEAYKEIEHIKSTIPFTKEFLGSPIVNKEKKVVAMISHTSGSKTFDSENKYLSSSSILNFISNKQEFKEIGKKTNISTTKKSKRKKYSKNLKGKDLNKFINQRTKELKKLLAEFKKDTKSLQYQQPNGPKRKKIEQAKQNVTKVKQLMDKKEKIKKKKEDAYKELIQKQEDLDNMNSLKLKDREKERKVQEEIKSLEKNNRDNTLKIALNKKKIKAIKKTSDIKMVLKANSLMVDNIKLSDNRIKKLKSHLKRIIANNKKPQKGKQALKDEIKKLNSTIKGYTDNMNSLEAEAFDYFNDAI